MMTSQQKIKQLKKLDEQRKQTIRQAEELASQEKELVRELANEGVSLYRIREDTGLDWHTAKRWAGQNKMESNNEE